MTWAERAEILLHQSLSIVSQTPRTPWLMMIDLWKMINLFYFNKYKLYLNSLTITNDKMILWAKYFLFGLKYLRSQNGSEWLSPGSQVSISGLCKWLVVSYQCDITSQYLRQFSQIEDLVKCTQPQLKCSFLFGNISVLAVTASIYSSGFSISKLSKGTRIQQLNVEL